MLPPSLKAAFIAAAAGLVSLTPAAGQETPSAPIPYDQLNPRPKPAPRPATPRPAPRVQAPAPAAETPAQTFEALSASNPIPPQQLEAFVDGVVRQAMASDHIGGVTVSVVQNGQVVLKKGYGFATVQPARAVDPDRTLFRIGSISKTFTWIALMKEIEAGRIRLDAPVNLYLPQRIQVRDQGYDQPVTVRHLMTHTAGFEDRALGQLFERDYDRVRPLQVYLRQERPSRVRAPGAAVSYSNYGAALAGAAVSNVTGQPFETLIERTITIPLGLARTTFREPHPVKNGLPAPMNGAIAADVAEGLAWTPLGYRERPFEYVGQIAPAGSASSTAADMARYMLLLLNGGALDGASVFSPQVARWMRTTLYRPAPGAAGWNYGFQDIPLPGGRRGFGHAGATLSFHSNMVLAPDLGLGVFISTNTDTGYPLAQGLAGQIVSHFYAPASELPPAGSAALFRQRAVYEGDYLVNRRAHGGLEGFVTSLIGFTRVAVTPAGYLSTTGQSGVELWAPTRQPGVFRAVNDARQLVFQMEDGRAARFVMPSGGAIAERRGDLGSPALLALAAAVTVLASLATLIGIFFRDRRSVRESQVQRRASLMQNSQAALWLVAIASFGAWAAGTSDVTKVVYDWPGPWVVLASACALVAAVLTFFTLLLLPVIWRGGRRVDSWTAGRKLRFTFTTLVFSAFAALLGWWGALFPWSG